MPRSIGPFDPPTLPSGALEFRRDLNFTDTTDPCDLARALQQEKSHDWISATRVLSPNEPQ